MSFLILLQLISSLSFFCYGLSCLVSRHMKIEFARYGLPQFRVLTGLLQIAGSLGLFVGFYFPPLVFLASLGLSSLMFLGVGVRLKIQDPWFAALPAFFFMCLNVLILLIHFQMISDFRLFF